jgi:hypothetical protein
MVLFLESDRDGLEAKLRADVASMEDRERQLYLANTLAHWAIALSELGRGAAALEAVERGRGTTVAEDVADQITLDTAEAYARALLGDLPAAREALRRAGERARGIDMRIVTDELEWARSQVDRLAGDREAAAARLRRLAEDSEARGFLRFAERYRRDLAALA